MTLVDTFVEFARLKLAADRSDAYIEGTVAIAAEVGDPYWYAGCFTTPYAPPTSEVLYERWSREEVLIRPTDFAAWVAANWARLPVSGARNVNGMGPVKFADTLVRYARWLEDGGVESLPRDDAPTTFKALRKGVANHGRYTGMKLYETLRRLGADVPPFDDLVPAGGRTPRKALARMFPEHDPRPDRPTQLAEANRLADELRQAIPASWFDVEVLLCNFHQALDGHFYPGYALDKELERAFQVRAGFPNGGRRTLANRPLLYSGIYLGERRGWNGVRRDLGRVLAQHGYVWSDARYNWHTSRNDLSKPVRW